MNTLNTFAMTQVSGGMSSAVEYARSDQFSNKIYESLKIPKTSQYPLFGLPVSLFLSDLRLPGATLTRAVSRSVGLLGGLYATYFLVNVFND